MLRNQSSSYTSVPKYCPFKTAGLSPLHGGFPARSKLHRAQIGALLRVAPGTYVPAVAIQATTIPPIQPLARGSPEVSFCALLGLNVRALAHNRTVKINHHQGATTKRLAMDLLREP